MSKPLWEVIEGCDAFMPVHGLLRRRLIAALIRAVRDWLAPDEAEPPVGEGEPWPQAYQQRSDAMWEQRQVLRALLTAEADRAERRKGSND